jgi:hypothetical protein
MNDHFDFDRLDLWGPELTVRLEGIVSPDVRRRVADSDPEFVEDARDTLFGLVEADAVNTAVAEWVSERPIAAYHGSRLTEAEIAAIQKGGLRPLRIEDRRARLVRALSQHQDWPAKSHRLAEALELHGKGERAGRREGQVHLTLSRAGLVKSFNHYLTHGAEVDQHLAHHVLGDEGINLLRRDGVPIVFRCLVPPDVAIPACNRFTIGTPYPVPEVVPEWAYWLAKPQRAMECIQADCGLVLHNQMPAEWIVGVERLSDGHLLPD